MSDNNPVASSPPRPLWIGITTKHGSAAWVQRNSHNYVNRVKDYAAEPIVLAPDAPVHLPDGAVFMPDEDGRLPRAILAQLDGIIFSGGGDVHPRHFGAELAGAEPHAIDEKRDVLEIDLAQAALAMDLPIFGICRGCQVLNVAAGGAMVQHLEGHRSPEGGPTVYHDVILEPDSKLSAIVGAAALPVNTYHHQGMNVDALASTFVPAALAHPDAWLVEAYESPQHTWVVGVQWHPERSFELDHGHRRIWDSFVAACRAHQATAAQP